MITIENVFLSVGLIALCITIYRVFAKNNSGYLLTWLQNFLGVFFIFSGMVKAVDPLGTSFKLHDYFMEFSKDGFASFWTMLDNMKLSISIFLIGLEVMVGVCLLTGYWVKFSAFLMFALNLFFLVLTGYSYLSGFCISEQLILTTIIIAFLLLLSSMIKEDKKRRYALLFLLVLIGVVVAYCKASGVCMLCEFTETKMKVKDCGCFGDFLKIKPWQTFYKDIILTTMSIYLIWFINDLRSFKTIANQRIIVYFSLVFVAIFMIYNTFMDLPMFDFRAYKKGVNIRTQSQVVKQPVIKNVFLYKHKQSGEVKEFEVTSLPKDMENWTFVDRKDQIIDPGIPAPISDFKVYDSLGGDLTQDILNQPNEAIWIISYDVDEINRNFIENTLPKLMEEYSKSKKTVYFISNKPDKTIQEIYKEKMYYLQADQTVLKTIMRANPGVMSVKDGVILDKKHFRKL